MNRARQGQSHEVPSRAPLPSHLLPRSVVRLTLILALYALAALVQTAPLALHLTTSIPFGNDTVPTIARLNLWTLWWNSDRLVHGYRGYWQAPIFYPEPYSFVYSETQWLTGLVASPLWWITGNPALTYNVVVLVAFAPTGWAGCFLLRRLRIRFWPAVCGGLTMELLPTTADQSGVLQSIVVLFPILMTLACLVGFGRTGLLPSALGIGIWMAASFHTSSNMALFFAPTILLGVLLVAGHRAIRPRAAFNLASATFLSAVLIAPIAVVQSRVLKTLNRHTYSEIAGTSAWACPDSVDTCVMLLAPSPRSAARKQRG